MFSFCVCGGIPNCCPIVVCCCVLVFCKHPLLWVSRGLWRSIGMTKLWKWVTSWKGQAMPSCSPGMDVSMFSSREIDRCSGVFMNERLWKGHGLQTWEPHPDKRKNRFRRKPPDNKTRLKISQTPRNSCRSTLWNVFFRYSKATPQMPGPAGRDSDGFLQTPWRFVPIPDLPIVSQQKIWLLDFHSVAVNPSTQKEAS